MHWKWQEDAAMASVFLWVTTTDCHLPRSLTDKLPEPLKPVLSSLAHLGLPYAV